MAYIILDWYDTPRHYDIVFDTDTSLEFNFLQRLWREYGRSTGRRVLEPACGTGRLLARFAKTGCDVNGFDASRAMVHYTRQRLRRRRLKGELTVGRLEAFAYPKPFDFTFNLVSTFKYLLTEHDARSHLQCIADVLRPGGIYVLGFHLTDYTNNRRQRERWVGRRGRTQVVCNIQGWPADARKRIERVRSRLIVHEGAREKRFETSWLFRTYSASQFKRLLSSVAALEHIAAYDFHYDIRVPRKLGDCLDTIVVLKRRG